MIIDLFLFGMFQKKLADSDNNRFLYISHLRTSSTSSGCCLCSIFVISLSKISSEPFSYSHQLCLLPWLQCISKQATSKLNSIAQSTLAVSPHPLLWLSMLSCESKQNSFWKNSQVMIRMVTLFSVSQMDLVLKLHGWRSHTWLWRLHSTLWCCLTWSLRSFAVALTFCFGDSCL